MDDMEKAKFAARTLLVVTETSENSDAQTVYNTLRQLQPHLEHLSAHDVVMVCASLAAANAYAMGDDDEVALAAMGKIANVLLQTDKRERPEQAAARGNPPN